MKLHNYFLCFLLFLLPACKTPLKPVSSSEMLYSIKDSGSSDNTSDIERLLKPYRDSLTGSMNEVIGQTAGDLVKEKPGGSLGNMVTDAMYTVAKKIDTNCIGAICNYGGIRIPEIKKGDITKGKIYELLPFENELVILEIKGDVLEKWLNLIAASGGWPIVYKRYLYGRPYNRSFLFQGNKLDNTRPDTSYVEMSNGALNMVLDKNTLEPDADYHIATSDYIANGGDNCEFLKGQKRTNTGLLIRDIVMDEIRMQQVIKPDNQQRMKFQK